MSLRLIFRVEKGNVDQIHPYKFSRESLDHMLEYAKGRVEGGVWARARIQTTVNEDVLWDSLLGHEIVVTDKIEIDEDRADQNKIWRDLDGNWHFPPVYNLIIGD